MPVVTGVFLDHVPADIPGINLAPTTALWTTSS